MARPSDAQLDLQLDPHPDPHKDDAHPLAAVGPATGAEAGPASLGDAARSLAAGELCGEADALRTLREQVLRLAPLDTTVLVTGETGTGKGVTARLLHRLSGRRGAFVHADCASLPPTLFESELFGHERGAFTGAASRRRGRIERAEGGTLFLDEIGELLPALQARLLRVLQDRRFERLGGGEALPSTARVVAATSRDLRAAVGAGGFRADLYYRIAVARLHLPPLRERRGDVARLAQDGLARIARRLGLPAPVLPTSAVARLAAAPWPGNVRELHNALERLAIACPGREVRDGDLAAALEEPIGAAEAEVAHPLARASAIRAAGGPDCACATPSPAAIAAALAAYGGNVSRAARRLGLSRSTLRRRIARLGLGGASADPEVLPPPRISPAPSTPRSPAGAAR